MRESNAVLQKRYRTRKALFDKFVKLYPDVEVEPSDVIVVRANGKIVLYSDSGKMLGKVTLQ